MTRVLLNPFELPDRWIASALAGAWILVAALASGRPRKAGLLIFALSLQVGLALYLTTPPPIPSVGSSWPNSLALPLASLAALGALATGLSRPPVWNWPFAISAALLVITTGASVLDSPVRFIGLSHVVLWLAYFVILIAAASTVREEPDFELVLHALMISLALQSLIYFVQCLAGATFTPAGEWIEPRDADFGRYGGTVGARPAVFSSFLLPLLLIALAHFLMGRRYGFPAAAGFTALVLTYTRASWAGFVLGFTYLLAAGARRRMLVRGRLWAALAALLIIGIVLSPKILMRVGNDHHADFEERWTLVRMAFRVMEANPWAGVGAGAYPYVFRDYLTPDLADRWLYVVHNVYMLRAAETGLPGLAAWLIFLCLAFRAAAPERMTLLPSVWRTALGCRAGVIALGWEMLWDVSLGPAANSLLWFLCGLMLAAARLNRGRQG